MFYILPADAHTDCCRRELWTVTLAENILRRELHPYTEVVELETAYPFEAYAVHSCSVLLFSYIPSVCILLLRLHAQSVVERNHRTEAEVTFSEKLIACGQRECIGNNLYAREFRCYAAFVWCKTHHLVIVDEEAVVVDHAVVAPLQTIV